MCSISRIATSLLVAGLCIALFPSPLHGASTAKKEEKLKVKNATVEEGLNTPPLNGSASQQVSVVASKDLLTSPSDYGHKKGHKGSFHVEKGHKGDKGFKKHKGYKGSHQSKKGKHGKKGGFSKGGKHHKGHHKKKGHHSKHLSGKKGHKGHKHGVKKHHNKGHKKKGFKNQYHKEEAGKTSKFYDDAALKKYHSKWDHQKKYFKVHKGGHHKGNTKKGGKHHDKHHKKGHFKKGKKHSHKKGHKGAHGHKSHHGHKKKFGKKSGKKSKKGSKHGHKGHHGHGGHHGGYSHNYESYYPAPVRPQKLHGDSAELDEHSNHGAYLHSDDAQDRHSNSGEQPNDDREGAGYTEEDDPRSLEEFEPEESISPEKSGSHHHKDRRFYDDDEVDEYDNAERELIDNDNNHHYEPSESHKHKDRRHKDRRHKNKGVRLFNEAYNHKHDDNNDHNHRSNHQNHHGQQSDEDSYEKDFDKDQTEKEFDRDNLEKDFDRLHPEKELFNHEQSDKGFDQPPENELPSEYKKKHSHSRPFLYPVEVTQPVHHPEQYEPKDVPLPSHPAFQPPVYKSQFKKPKKAPQYAHLEKKIPRRKFAQSTKNKKIELSPFKNFNFESFGDFKRIEGLNA